MSDVDHPLGDTEVEVVEPSTGASGFPIRRAIAIAVTTLVVASGAYAFWTGSDEQRNVAAFSTGSEPPSTDSVVTSTVEIATTSTSTSTTFSSTTTVLSDPDDDEANAIAAGACSWSIPNLVGKTMWETAGPLHGCLNQFSMGLGPAVSFELHTTSEPCTTDPALYDRIGSQSPSPGTPFGGGIVRIDLSVYRNCSIPTTTVPAPLPPVPTAPTTETTEPAPTIPEPPAP